MKIKYDGVDIALLDVKRVPSLSGWRGGKQIAAELRLINHERTFDVLIGGGYVEADPVKIESFTRLNQLPTMKEIQDRYAPVNNMSIVDLRYYSKLKPGTPEHNSMVGNPAYRVTTLEVGAGIMTFRNGAQRDVYFQLRPTTREELVEATEQTEARRAESDTPAGNPKRAQVSRRNGKQSEGRPPKITEAQKNAAVHEIMRRRRDNHANGGSLARRPACDFYLREHPLPIKADRMAQLVKAAERPRSGKN